MPEHARQLDFDPPEVTFGYGRFCCKSRLGPAANRGSVVFATLGEVDP
jgi:hypothetical protein